MYSKHIDNDSIRQVLLNLLTIKSDLKNENENFNYEKNLNKRYLTTSLLIIEKFLSFYLPNFYYESKKISEFYYSELEKSKNISDTNNPNSLTMINISIQNEFLEKLFNYKFKTKNIFILILKFLKFVDNYYPNKIDDIILKIFQFENLKKIEKILFQKSNEETEINISDIYIYEEYLFFFCYFLKISFNKKNANKDYLMNNFLIDDYETLYNESNVFTNTPNDGNVNNIQDNNIEGQVLSTGENISGKVDNLYSCSFNLEEKLNDSTKMFLLEFYFTNFLNFYNTVNKIKKFYLDINNLNGQNNLVNKTLFKSFFFKSAVSSSYIYFLDILIILFDQNIKEFSIKKIIKEKNFPKDLFENLTNDILFYKSNVFVQIKILRIFELLSISENIQNQIVLKIFIEIKMINKNLLIKILEKIYFKKYIDLEK